MIAWFEKRIGEPIMVGTEDPTMLLLGDSIPDWVRLPPDLGGRRVRVEAVGVDTCPRGEHDVRHLRLSDCGISVAECPEHGGYLWYRTGTPSEVSEDLPVNDGPVRGMYVID